MSDGDRADRLRRRRQRARDRAQGESSADEDDADADGDDRVPESKDEETEAESGETDETAEAGTPSETAKPAKTGETDERDETDDTSGDETSSEDGTASDAAERGGVGGESPTTSVKDEQKPTYMYLPHDVRRDLDRAYAMLKADYEYEFDESFEKNRHFYPLVVSLGLDAMDELDAESVRERLE